MSEAFGFEPPKREIRWPICRVLAGHDTEVTLLAGEWFSVATHFYKRTLLCTGTEDCPLCSALPGRRYYYLPAAGTAVKSRLLLEMSPLAAADLEQNCKLLAGRMGAGQVLRISRRGPKSPLKTEYLNDRGAQRDAPLHVWVSAVLAIHSLPALQEGESFGAYRDRTVLKVRTRAEQALASLTKGRETGTKGRVF